MSSYGLQLTFARGATDTDQLNAFVQQGVGAAGDVSFVTLPLPDVWLSPNSYIQLQRFTNDGSDQTLTEIVVTYTPDGVGAASTAPVDLTPYLLPATPTG